MTKRDELTIWLTRNHPDVMTTFRRQQREKQKSGGEKSSLVSVSLPGGVKAKAKPDASLSIMLSRQQITAEQFFGGSQFCDDITMVTLGGKSAPELGVAVDNSGSGDQAPTRAIDAARRVRQVRARLDFVGWSVLVLCTRDGWSINQLAKQTDENDRYLSGLLRHVLDVAAEVYAGEKAGTRRSKLIQMGAQATGESAIRRIARGGGGEYWWAQLDGEFAVVSVYRDGAGPIDQREVSHVYFTGNAMGVPVSEFEHFALVRRVESPHVDTAPKQVRAAAR